MTDDLKPGDEESLKSQIDRLANFIMAEVPGEPSQSQGAVDTAIRVMRGHLEAATAIRELVAAAKADVRTSRLAAALNTPAIKQLAEDTP